MSTDTVVAAGAHSRSGVPTTSLTVGTPDRDCPPRSAEYPIGVTSPIIPSPGFTVINTTTDGTVVDLPVGEWPTMTRIEPSDLVGPSAANRQHKAIQKRLSTVAARFDVVMLGLNRITGVSAVGGNLAQRVHAWTDAPITIPGTPGSPDGRDYYLPRDGSAMMWGRLPLGNARTLVYGFDSAGYHWIQGPGNVSYSGSGTPDVDRILGIQRIAANDYRLHLFVGGSSSQVATTADVATAVGAASLAGDVTGILSNTVVGRVAGTVPGNTGLSLLSSVSPAAARIVLGIDDTGSSRPPSGSAGGDLTGTYPNPTIPALADTGKNACGTRYVNTGTPPSGTGIDGDIWYQVA